MNDATIAAAAWLQSWKVVLGEALRDDERGQGMVEYGLILALVAIAAIVALGFLSGGIQTNLNRVGSAVKATVTPLPTPTS